MYLECGELNSFRTAVSFRRQATQNIKQVVHKTGLRPKKGINYHGIVLKTPPGGITKKSIFVATHVRLLRHLLIVRKSLLILIIEQKKGTDFYIHGASAPRRPTTLAFAPRRGYTKMHADGGFGEKGGFSHYDRSQREYL